MLQVLPLAKRFAQVRMRLTAAFEQPGERSDVLRVFAEWGREQASVECCHVLLAEHARCWPVPGTRSGLRLNAISRVADVHSFSRAQEVAAAEMKVG